MPHVDFGRAFSQPEKSVSPVAHEEIARAPELPGRDQIPAARLRCSCLGLAEWTNLIFTVIAVLGGLFCAFYFFNGTDLLRSATSWPREYLFPSQGPPDDGSDDRSRLAQFLGLLAPPEAKAARGRSGDPFSRASDLLNPSRSRLVRAASAAGLSLGSSAPSRGFVGGLSRPESLLSGLGLRAPDGDALTQNFNRAVSNLQRATRSSAERTVRVVRTPRTRFEKSDTGHARNSADRAPDAAARGAGQAMSHRGRFQEMASSTLDSATPLSQQRVTSAPGGRSGVFHEFRGMRQAGGRAGMSGAGGRGR